MRSRKIRNVGILVFLAATLALAQEAERCQRGYDRDSWSCNDYDTPERVEFAIDHDEWNEGNIEIRKGGPKARSFTFINDGMLLVFVWNETDDPAKNMSSSSGSRTYWFLPVNKVAAEAVQAEQTFRLTSAAGVSVELSKTTGKIVSLDRAEFTEAEHIAKIVSSCNERAHPGSCGGFEITRAKYGLVWDLGWSGGGTTKTRPRGASRLIDKAGQTCALVNRELLDYSKDREEPQLRYPTNDSLFAFLSKRCPRLDLSDLLATDKR